MAKGNSVKGSKGASGGAGMKKVGGGAKKGPPGGKPDKQRKNKSEKKQKKGAKGDDAKQQYGKGAGTPGGKPRKRQPHGSAPDPTEEEDSDVDESLGEGLEEYAGYSNFLLDMDAEKLKPEKVKAAEGQESRKEKKKRKAEEREARGEDGDGGMGKGSDDESDEDEETQYESRPRKSAKWAEKKAEALPVKGPDGKWSIPEKAKVVIPAKEAEAPETVSGHEQSDSEDDLVSTHDMFWQIEVFFEPLFEACF